MTDHDFLQLHRTLLSLIRARGAGRWRIGADIADAAYDRVVDRLLAADADPEELVAFASRVALNLIQSGPQRRELTRDGALSTSDELGDPNSPDPDREKHRADAAGDATGTPWIVALVDQHGKLLTTLERKAVLATPGTTSTREAAARAGMTPRDYRIRIRRAASKLRSSWEDNGRPL